MEQVRGDSSGRIAELARSSSVELLAHGGGYFWRLPCRFQFWSSHLSYRGRRGLVTYATLRLPATLRRTPYVISWSTARNSRATLIAPRAANGSTEATFGKSAPGRPSAASIAIMGPGERQNLM